MFHDAPNVNYLFAELLVEELVRHGVEWFVISPGSRSAPLAWTVASHPRAKHVVHFDERGAAFHALGIAKATMKPAAFICTSGTAAANALPAAVEASYSGIPLVLITADRPERLQGSGANQTINQHGLYREFVRHESNFAVDPAEFDPVTVLTEIDRAMADATALWPGPIHLNCQMDEPLAPEAASGGPPDWSAKLESVADWMNRTGVFLSDTPAHPLIPAGELDRLVNATAGTARGVVVVGQLPPTSERASARELITILDWPCIADITSGIAFGLDLSPAFAKHRMAEFLDTADVLLHIGGSVTSRRMLDAVAAFASNKGHAREYIRVSPSPDALDPHRAVTQRIHTDVATLTRELASSLGPHVRPTKDFAKTLWDLPADVLERQQAALGALLAAEFADDRPVSEPAAACLCSRARLDGEILFLGNSMPIRDVDTYFGGTFRSPAVLANRGASGIDGNIATAAGAARATRNGVTALIGDLATLHDMNSLALLRDLDTPFALVILNNDGGGIFHFLPIARHTQHFEELFGTPHGLEFESAARMFGLPYHRPKTNAEFRRARNAALERNGATIIEVRTDRAENLRLHRELDAKIRAVLDKA